MTADVHQSRDLADQAWARYQQWLQRLATLPRAQGDMFGDLDARASAREWRGIWCACEREITRVAANG